MFRIGNSSRLAFGFWTLVLIAVGLLMAYSLQCNHAQRRRVELQSSISNFTGVHLHRDYREAMLQLRAQKIDESSSVKKAISFFFVGCRRYNTCITVFWDPADSHKVILEARRVFTEPYVNHGQMNPALDRLVETACTRAQLPDQQCQLFATAIDPGVLSKFEPFEEANRTESGYRPRDVVDGDLWLLESWDSGTYRAVVRENLRDGPVFQECMKLVELAKMNRFKPDQSLPAL